MHAHPNLKRPEANTLTEAIEFWYAKIAHEIFPLMPLIEKDHYDLFLTHLGGLTEARRRWHGPFDTPPMLPLAAELKSIGAYYVYYVGTGKIKNGILPSRDTTRQWQEAISPLWNEYKRYTEALNKDNAGVVGNF